MTRQILVIYFKQPENGSIREISHGHFLLIFIFNYLAELELHFDGGDCCGCDADWDSGKWDCCYSSEYPRWALKWATHDPFPVQTHICCDVI